MDPIIDINLLRTFTTLDLSQKAEKGMRRGEGGGGGLVLVPAAQRDRHYGVDGAATAPLCCTFSSDTSAIRQLIRSYLMRECPFSSAWRRLGGHAPEVGLRVPRRGVAETPSLPAAAQLRHLR